MKAKIFTVYALSSLSRSYIYVGFSSKLENRILRHQKGYERTTRPYRPFDLIYSKEFTNRVDARKHEKYLKSGSGKEFLKQLREGASSSN